MTTPGFNPGAVRFQPRSSQSSGNGSSRNVSRPQPGPAQPSRRQSRQTRVQSAPQSTMEMLKPILFLAIANALAIVALFGVISVILSPIGIAAAIQGVKFGVRGVKMLFGRA